MRDARLSRARCGSSWSSWPGRIRAGATGASRVSWSAWGTGSVRGRSAGSWPLPGCGLRRVGHRPPGGSSWPRRHLHPGVRFSACRHGLPPPRVRLVRDGDPDPDRVYPGRHRGPDRSLDCPAGPEPAHGSRRTRRPFQVPESVTGTVSSPRHLTTYSRGTPRGSSRPPSGHHGRTHWRTGSWEHFAASAWTMC